MKENFNILRKEFIKIKNLGAIKSMRKGTTGIGYTFEYLLNKKEDKKSYPDFLGIELKTKLGYSKSPLTLFNCAPVRNNDYVTSYLLKKYAIKKINSSNCFVFERDIYCNKSYKNYYYTFKLKVDYYKQQIIVKSFCNGKFIENVCYWDFKILERTLKRKLTYLSIIEGYPYIYNNDMYYKYFKMSTFKLKDFLDFLFLIEKDKIFVSIYITKDNSNIVNHGYSFRIKNDCIEELFFKLPY